MLKAIRTRPPASAIRPPSQVRTTFDLVIDSKPPQPASRAADMEARARLPATDGPFGDRGHQAALESRVVFTVEQRDALRDRVLELARADGRVIAGALVGSLAAGGGDQYSDLDL